MPSYPNVGQPGPVGRRIRQIRAPSGIGQPPASTLPPVSITPPIGPPNQPTDYQPYPMVRGGPTQGGPPGPNNLEGGYQPYPMPTPRPYGGGGPNIGGGNLRPFTRNLGQSAAGGLPGQPPRQPLYTRNLGSPQLPPTPPPTNTSGEPGLFNWEEWMQTLPPMIQSKLRPQFGPAVGSMRGESQQPFPLPPIIGAPEPAPTPPLPPFPGKPGITPAYGGENPFQPPYGKKVARRRRF